MFPYFELFGMRRYMIGIGIVISGIVFLLTAYQLCKKYNQDFVKLFHWFPLLLVSIYFLGLYSSYFLETGNLFPTSLKVFSPYGYRFALVGILIAAFGSLLIFLKSFRRSESKKIWIDIFFFSFINALVPLGIFLVLGDSFVGKPYTGLISVSALMPESALMKFEGVYPIGLFLSIGAVLINLIITLWKITSQKVWLGLRGFVLLLALLLGILPFWNYPAHGVIALGKWSIDLNHMLLIGVIGMFVLLARRWRKPY